ncbi:hypothetical protein ARMSODRAFT_1017306 [Armillaria solidipes]|uniref:Uncharacterized protein n=1 Tax=Armillaria solidipes TaxID=1076256 RepID=A0A2H3BWP6_9AGAR|nr:hypothetical protein ARMSODRAFT_1017306 [Armillaria solidipes]
MLTNGLVIECESNRNAMNAQKPNLLHTGIVYGCNSIQPVFAQLHVLNANNCSHTPEAFDLNQYLQDEYAYLDYLKYARSYKDPVEEVIIFHSGSQVLSYDFSSLNLVNKLVSALVMDDFADVLKWHGNVVVLSVVAEKVKSFHQCEQEIEHVNAVVHNYIRFFLGKRYGWLKEFQACSSQQTKITTDVGS